MDSLQAYDEGTLFWFETHHLPWLTPVMKLLTIVGNWYIVLVVAVLIAAGFFRWRRPRTAVCFMSMALLALLLCEGVKHFVSRPRPDVRWRLIARPHSWSFPSGHSFNSMAIYGGAAMLAARGLRRRSRQIPLVAAGLVLPVAIGISRPYLGVHYPIDVIGGLSGGLGCALLGLWADQRWGYRPQGLSPGLAALPPHALPGPPDGIQTAELGVQPK
jgi:membrane-associated phospholipid phosphatase